MKIVTYQLDHVCEKITDGTHHSPPVSDSGIPYVTAKHIKEDGVRFFDDPWFVSEQDHAAIYSRCDPRKGDVLYIKDGATTGIAAVNEFDFPFSMLSSVALLRPRLDLCDPRFLVKWLNSPMVKEWNLRQMGGAAIKRLTLAKIKKFQIPLPPLAEQKRIARILDAADALRAKRRAAIAQLDALAQSLFLDLFGDPVTNPKGWEVKALGEFIRFVGGSQPPKETFVYEPREGFVRLVQIRDFKSDKFPTYIPTKLAKRPFSAEDVMIARYGPPVFQILTGLSGSYNVALMKADPIGEVEKKFIFHLLSLPTINLAVVAQSERTAGQSGVNLDFLNSYPAYLPPLPLQQRFAAAVEAIERQKARHREQLAGLDALFASLQHRAFRGEL